MSARVTFPTETARYAGMVFILVAVASLVGIYSRPLGHLASVWPANALLLCMLVRAPDIVPRSIIWTAAVAGYLAADFATGSTVLKTIPLTCGNLVTVGTGYFFLRRLTAVMRHMRQPTSIPIVSAICVVAASASALTGAILNPYLFGGTVTGGLNYWFVTELVNYLAFLPAFLTFPSLECLRRFPRWGEPGTVRNIGWRVFPIIALLASCCLALLVGGPGSIVLPLPFLLWCAVSYRFFETTVLTLVYSAWALISITIGWLMMPGIAVNDIDAILSLRLGLSFVALGPLAVASVMAARNELLARTKKLADYDALTDVFNRRAFRDVAGKALSRSFNTNLHSALLMLDIDRFKSINDTYGHAVGDQVLVAFASQLRLSLRERDVIGRLGGEEFAVLLSPCGHAEAMETAERLRAAFADLSIEIGETYPLRGTVSIGIAGTDAVGHDLDAMLREADRHLYRAKNGGRNRVAAAESVAGEVRLARQA